MLLSSQISKIVDMALAESLSRRNLRLVSQNGLAELLAQLEAAKVRDHVYEANPLHVRLPAKLAQNTD